MRMVTLDASIRHQLICLARSTKSRSTEFTVRAPTDWRPTDVRNPNGEFDDYFTDHSAWEFIAMKLEEGHPVEIIPLRKPEGKTGYVMHIDIEPNQAKLYVKLQLGSGKIIGRSFHYSKYGK